MKLSELVRNLANSHWSDALRNIVYADLHLAADIIDSLPTAQDGSVIVPGRWAVCKRWGDDDTLNVEVAEINSVEFWRDKSGYVFYSDHPVSTQGFDYILSTHRTREEAEAAAKRAGGEG